jgi:hypothetical protein
MRNEGVRQDGNILVQYKDNQNVSSTMPIRLIVTYSIGWSGADTEKHVFRMASESKYKRTSITTMRAKNRAFAIFPTPLISHCPLPLRPPNTIPKINLNLLTF